MKAITEYGYRTPYQSPVQRKQGGRKIIRFVLIGSGLFLVAAVLFIKFDTAAAAEFTDSVLRPVLGADRVIALEKVFFNASDQAQKVEYKYKQPDNPLINPTADAVIKPQPKASSGLNLPTLPSSYFTPLAGEGVWQNYPLALFPNQQVMAHTLLRPDTQRSYAFTTVVALDMHQFQLSAVAGQSQPGGPVGNKGPGVIPQAITDSGNLVAAFDGGFQYRDGQYGMIVGAKTYLPLKQGIATLVGYTDGTLKIVNYTGQNFGTNVAFIRQNCPMLIEDGTVGTLNDKDKALWGRTLTSDILTWRSGIGLTADGNLLFAVGNNLTPTTLAYALKTAGAVNAMQLDINPHWVRFNIFDKKPTGGYTTATLMKGITDGSKQYLTGYEKDFFYLYKKSSG